MRKNILFLALALTVALFANARQRTTREMMKIATEVLASAVSSETVATRSAAGLGIIEQREQYTVIGYPTGGFAVIANDDMYDAVLGYSDTEFTGTLNPAFRWWLESMNESLTYQSLNDGASEKTMKSAAYQESVDKLMTTTWGQGDPYNLYTPTYNSGKNHYVVGCVATAMAQIMFYHKYPTQGKGSVSYRFEPKTGEGTTPIYVNFGKTTYEWDKMLPSYKSGYTEEQSKAVATIMYHCGASVQMQYTEDGSGAFTSSACTSLSKYFQYDSNLKFYMRTYFPKQEWMDLIYKELDEGFPVLYGGQASSGGHEFVFDGYDKNGLVHVNWGWEGRQDGFFNIDALNGYRTGQEMVLVRMPHEDSQYESSWGLKEGIKISKVTKKTINASFSAAYNLNPTKFSGTFALLAQNMETGEITSLNSQTTEMEYGHGFSYSQTGISLSNLAAGQYRLYFGTKASTEKNWQPVRCHEDYSNSYLLVMAEDGMQSLTDEKNANWTGIQAVVTDVSGNVQVFDTMGRLVYQAPSKQFSIEDIPAKGVLLIKNGNIVRKITR